MNADVTTEPTATAVSLCPRCGQPLAPRTVQTALWRDNQPVIVEDIPAYVCAPCMDQFYDDDVTEALRRLAEADFPAEQAVREIVVRVFSLKNSIRRREPLPDNTYVD